MTFLPLGFHIIIFLLVSLCIIFSFTEGSFILSLLYILVVFFSRKNKVEEVPVNSNQNYSSPVDGVITKIITKLDEYNVIRIVMNPWNRYGIIAPVEFEVSGIDYFKDVTPLFRYFRRSFLVRGKLDLIIDFKNSHNEQFSIGFKRCFFSGFPRLNVLPGDRCHMGVICGFFPVGGTILLYLPKSLKIDVSKGDRVFSGKTVIAFKEEQK